MPVAVQSLPLDTVKMDDRKRPAPDDSAHATPRLKRQAVTVNGAPARVEDDIPRSDDLDRYQKDAILRQMREYKREKLALEQQLALAHKRSEYHDEHLRIVDAWFLQLLDELSLLYNKLPSSHPDRLEFRSALISAQPQKFQDHLSQRSEEIKSTITRLYSNDISAPADVKELQERLSSLLAEEKVHAAELQKAIVEKDQLDDRLFNATNRYMNAEKQLDRAKSAQVQKLETQMIASSRPEAAIATDSETKEKSSAAATGAALEATEIARKETVAVAAKQKEQLERLAEENKKTTESLTTARMKLSSLGEDDYANTELFKHFKAQHVEAIKRINDLEAKNIQLRDEAKSLHADRTAYREEADNELRNNSIEMQSQLAQTEADLARIRSTRDELMADLNVRKAAADQQRSALDHIKELAESRQARISVLESEIERLRQRDEARTVGSQDSEPDIATLQAKLAAAEREKAPLEAELRSMEASYKKAHAQATRKVSDMAETEEKIVRLSTEKAKADQKYFATMKAKESREYELKAIRNQHLKSSEIISQLKEAEGSCRATLINAEKQLADAKDSLQQLTDKHRIAQRSVADHKASADQLTTQAFELKKILSAGDEATQEAKKKQRDAEVKTEELNVRLEQSSKELESWKKKALGNQSEDLQYMKKLCWCTVCDKNIKDTVLTSCKHVMCRECIDKQLSLRQRRCPICNKAFGANDTLTITL